jgi:multiple sugar transport system substrate-binding protein
MIERIPALTRKVTSRRRFLQVVTLVGAGSLLAACAPAPAAAPTPPPAAPKPTTAAAAPTPAAAAYPTATPAVVAGAAFDWKRFSGRSIRVLLWEHPQVNEWKTHIPEFEAKTGIKVQWEQVSVADVYTKTILELSSAPEKLDVYSMVPPQHGLQFSRDGFMADLKPMLDDKSLTSSDYDYSDFLPGTAKSLVFNDGKLIGGVPMYINTGVLTYRKDLYAQEGLKPPQTFQELMDNAAALHDPSKEQYGVVLRGIGPQAVWHYSAWLWGYGGDWLGKDGKPAINTPQAIEAMNVYGGTLGKYGPPGPTDLDDGRMVAVFQAGKAAHHYSHPTYSKDFNDPAKSQVAGKLGWTLVPAGPAGRFTEAVGVGVSISGKSPNKEPSWFLLQFLTDKPMMEIAQTKVGIFTPRKSAWESPVFAAEVKRTNMEEWRDVTVTALETGRGDPLPPVVDMAAARDAIGVALTTAIRGGDVKAAADEANTKYQRLLAAG